VRRGSYMWLWLPGALIAAFVFALFLAGSLTPEYEKRAYDRYRMCVEFVKQGVFPLTTDCRAQREADIRIGRMSDLQSRH
jgi:hypothetical protein